MSAFKIPPSTECTGCGQPIGTSVLEANGAEVLNDFVTCWDGISSKVATFHKRCHTRLANPDPDVRKTIHVTLAPVVFNTKVNEVAS